MRNIYLAARKEWITLMAVLRNYFLFFVVIGGVIAAGNSAFGLSYLPVILIYLFVYNSAAYEERYQVNVINRTLPVRPGELVAGKYLVNIGSVIAVMLLWGAVNLISCTVQGVESEFMPMMLLMCMGCALIGSLMIPIIYRFGAAKSRMVVLLIYCGFFAASSVIVKMLPPSANGMSAWVAGGVVTAGIGIVGTVLAVLFSVFLSTRIFQKKYVI